VKLCDGVYLRHSRTNFNSKKSLTPSRKRRKEHDGRYRKLFASLAALREIFLSLSWASLGHVFVYVMQLVLREKGASRRTLRGAGICVRSVFNLWLRILPPSTQKEKTGVGL
jgi:hypothetical protein